MSISGVRSIGELAQQGALEFGDGYRTKRSEHAASGYRIIRVADVNGGAIQLGSPDFVSQAFERSIGGKAGRPGDILLTTKGTVGRVAIVPELHEAIVYSPQLCYFRVYDAEVIDPRYLSLWFRSDEFVHQASHRMNNTDMAAYINLADIRSLILRLPDLDEQRAIAEVLGALDDKIAANTKIVATIRESMKSLLSDRVPSIALSEIVDHLKKTIDVSRLTAPTVSHFSLPAFDIAEVPEITNPSSIMSSKFSIDEPSVLISKLNPRTPRIWDIQYVPDEPALASTEFLVLQPRYCSTTTLWAILSQPAFNSLLEGKVAGTSGSHQRVKPADLLATEVLDPRSIDAGLQDTITALGIRAQAARRENQTLATTRDALLPQLMSGKLRVRDAETAVEAVV